MRKRLLGSLVALTLSAPVGVALTATSADATTIYYRNCTALAAKVHHGVSRSRTAALRQVRAGYGMPAYGPLAQKVYWANYRSLDRDKDGTACER